MTPSPPPLSHRLVEGLRLFGWAAGGVGLLALLASLVLLDSPDDAWLHATFGFGLASLGLYAACGRGLPYMVTGRAAPERLLGGRGSPLEGGQAALVRAVGVLYTAVGVALGIGGGGVLVGALVRML